MLEPDVLKGTCLVLRGERGSNAPDLPDKFECLNFTTVKKEERDNLEIFFVLCRYTSKNEVYRVKKRKGEI